MNHFWSEQIQGVLTLYLSRKLRFHDAFQGKYRELFALDPRRKLRILEIGCGPGALHRWYPNADIVKGINAKFDTRMELLKNGDKQWDTDTAITMIVRGVKE